MPIGTKTVNLHPSVFFLNVYNCSFVLKAIRKTAIRTLVSTNNVQWKISWQKCRIWGNIATSKLGNIHIEENWVSAARLEQVVSEGENIKLQSAKPQQA